MLTLIGPFHQIITMDHLPFEGSLVDYPLEIIENGAIIVEDNYIKEIGSFQTLRSNKIDGFIEIPGKEILLPGFVDSHTHICYGGSRANDYTLKLEGASYQEILKHGGGIYSTVNKTRDADFNQLYNDTLEKANKHFFDGVTTTEIKSGYGLSVDDEIKMLEVIKKVGEFSYADIISTCLAAHVPPSGYNPNEYLDYIQKDLLPIIKQNNLSNRVDIFIEESAFSPKLAEGYLLGAQALGFDLTVHADQFTVGGSKIASKINAISADHLEVSGENEINLLKTKGVVATVLPGASLGLGINFAPARKILNSGCCLAIASDWNPGSAPMGDLLIQASLLSIYEKLTFSETIAGITFRASKALNLNDRGVLKKGMKADFISFSTHDYREILYHQGMLKPSRIWKNGNYYQK